MPLTPYQKLLRLADAHSELRPDLVPVLRRHRTASAAPEPKIAHGYDQPLAGGTDVMKRLQDQLLIEQGREPREPNPRLAACQQLQRGLIGVLVSPEGRQIVRNVVAKYAKETNTTVVVNAAVDDILTAAVAVALDPKRMGQIIAKHTTPE